jgi:hypothetical protein
MCVEYVHQSRPFNSLKFSRPALVGGSLFTPKRSKEETQRKTRSNSKNQLSEQTLRAEAVQSLYNKELCQCQASILIQPITRNLNVILLSRLTRCQSCEQPSDHAMICANCWQVIGFWPNHLHKNGLKVNFTRLIGCQSWEQPSDQVKICINYWQVINCWSNQPLLSINTSLIGM